MSSIEETNTAAVVETVPQTVEKKTETSASPVTAVSNPFAGLTASAVAPSSNENAKEEEAAAEGDDNEVIQGFVLCPLL